MSDEAVMLQARIDAMQIRSAALEADNARLRGLIKRVEWDSGESCDLCSWCSAWQFGTRFGAKGSHAPDCPAFTPTGEVK